MPIKNFDPTPASNLSSNGISIAENCPFANWNNYARQTSADLRNEIANVGANVASAATPTLDIDGAVVTVTGVTTVVGWATAITGLGRTVWYETSTPHTNSSALKCPGGANYTSAKGDVLRWRSFGAGNWAVEHTQLATGGPVIGALPSTTTLTSTDAGASAAPNLNFYRNSASPAVNDITGTILFTGKDSGGNDTVYAKINSFIADPTNGSEDGGVLFTTLVAGADGNWTWTSGELYYSSLLAAKNIAGAINATQVYVGGHGTVAQRVNDIESTLTTSATTIPFDDTIPQNTEGVEVLSVAITPINASSVLYIDVSVQVGLSTTNTVTAALFVDATASAIDAMGESVDASTIRTIKFTHVVSAGSTSARTYKVNVGGASGTVSLNGIAGTTRRYGGVTQSTITVTEVLPQ